MPLGEVTYDHSIILITVSQLCVTVNQLCHSQSICVTQFCVTVNQLCVSSGFGQAATTTTESSSGGGFGSLFGGGGGGGGVFGLGAKPSEEKAKQNVFGTTQAFGAAPAVSNCEL